MSAFASPSPELPYSTADALRECEMNDGNRTNLYAYVRCHKCSLAGLLFKLIDLKAMKEADWIVEIFHKFELLLVATYVIPPRFCMFWDFE